MCLFFGWKASTNKSEQTRILVLKTRRQDWCFHGAIEHLRAMWILICHHMNPYNITRFKIFKPYYSTVFNPYPPIIKRGKLMQAGKHLHFYTHIYSGLPHLFHIFSQLRSPPFGVGISMDFPSSQGMSHIFQKKHPCLFAPYVSMFRKGDRAIDFHRFQPRFNRSLFRHKKDFWSPHLGPSWFWASISVEPWRLKLWKVEERGDFTHIPHGKAMENWWKLA